MEDAAERGESAEADGVDDAKRRAEALVGTVISDRYRLHNLLAMGGMGAVFTAEHVHMRKRVAVKLLHPDTQGLPGLVARFEREAIVGAHVEHPNVAGARDFGRLADGSYYLVLEFVRGVTLRQLLHKGRIPPRRTARIAKQIATGLGAVHARGIVHRDVAPRNVMVLPGEDDRVKVIDFGFAKVPVEKFAAMSIQQGTPILPSEITNPGVIFGTIGYLAPEAVVGMKAVTAKSDLYALGAMLYEMLAGVPPFEAETQAGLFLQHRTEPVPPIHDRAPDADAPKELEAIARKLLAKRPEQRFASAEEVVAAIDAAIPALEPDSRSLPPSERSIELTVIGAEPLEALPRFEDVAEVTFDEPAESDARAAQEKSETRPKSSGRTDPEGAPSAPPKRSSSLWMLLVGLAVIVGGAFVLSRQTGMFSAPEPTSLPATAGDAPPPTATMEAPPATARPTAEQRPSASAPVATARPTEVDGVDVEGWKKVLRQAPSTNSYDKAAGAVLALAVLDPAALDTPDLQASAAETAVRFASDKERGPKLFDALAASFGASGVDVLYDIMTRRGGSRGAELATMELAKPEVRARASKAALIALELREAACLDKAKLAERARTEGDGRALAILVAARASCDSGACCLKDVPAVELAVRDLARKLETHE